MRGDLKAWLQASGWKLENAGKRWAFKDLWLRVDPSGVDPDMVLWTVWRDGVVLKSGFSVIETLQTFLVDLVD